MHPAAPAGLTPSQVFACDDAAVGLLSEIGVACQVAFERALERVQPAPDDANLLSDMSAIPFMGHPALLALDAYAKCQVRSLPPIAPAGSREDRQHP
jgi:hypothetical protein